MEENEAPQLKLTVRKGPLSGRVLDCKPRSKIQIGRVVRGNTLAIKDAGISSKHLVINFESGSGQWTVTDLGSSNGTILNGESLKPSAAYALSDGAVIKIGELTDIEVNVEVKVSEKVKGEKKREEDSRPRRMTRQRVAAEAVASVNLGVIDENSGLGLGLGLGEEMGKKNNVKGRGRRGRISKNEVVESRNLVEESENWAENIARRTRSSKMGAKLENAEETGNVAGGKAGPRRTRSSKKPEDFENGEEMRNVVVEKVSVRRTRRGNKEVVVNEVENDEGMKKGAVEEEKGQKINSRRTRGSVKEEKLGENWTKGGEVGNFDVVEGRTKKGTRGRKNLPVEESESVEDRNLREVDVVEKLDLGKGHEGEGGNLEGNGADVMEERENLNLVREGNDGLANTSGVNELGAEVDLEKMTLGEWLDYLEYYLPKQIIDQTEDMILGMRQKAEKFHKFMLQQKASKNKEEVCIR